MEAKEMRLYKIECAMRWADVVREEDAVDQVKWSAGIRWPTQIVGREN